MGKNTENIDKTLANNSSSNPAIPEPEVGSNILSAPQYSLDPNFTDTIDPLNLTNQSSDSMATIQPPEFNLNDKSSEKDSNESIENKSTISSNNINTTQDLEEEEKEISKEDKPEIDVAEDSPEDNSEGNTDEDSDSNINNEDNTSNEENDKNVTKEENSTNENIKSTQETSSEPIVISGGNNSTDPTPKISRGSGGGINIGSGGIPPGTPISAPETGPTIDEWKSNVSGDTNNIEGEELKSAEKVKTDIKTEGDKLRGERESKKGEYQGDLESKLPKIPELTEEPKAPADPIRKGVESMIAPHINKKLPDQSMPALNPTPSGISPKLGDSMEIIAFENEMHLLELTISEQSMVQEMGTDVDSLGSNQEKLELMKAALDKVLPTVNGESVPTLLKDPGAPPKISLPAEMQSDIGDVIARLLQDTNGTATKMIETVRKGAYANQSLHKTYPTMGNSEIASLTGVLQKDLSSIAEEAGLSAEELAAKIKEEKDRLTQKEEDAKATLTAENSEQICLLEAQGKEEKATIAEVKKVADEKALTQMEASKGENDPEVIKQKAASIKKDISTTVGQQIVAYDQSLKRRVDQLSQSQGQYINAYNMAAVREKNTIPQQSTEDKEEKKPDLKRGEVDVWKNGEIRTLKRQVITLQGTAKTNSNKYKTDLVAAATKAKDFVNNWEETETGKQKSWWRKLIESFTEWFTESKAEAESWQQINTQESMQSVKANIDLINQAKIKLGDEVTAESIDKMQGLTREQKIVLKAYYGGGPDSGDSIAAVGKGIIARITNQRSPDLVKKFTKELETKDSSEWQNLELIATSMNPSFSAGEKTKELYAAMKGGVTGWGTDEDRVFKALAGLSPFEVMVVKFCYKEKHNASLESHLTSELSGSEEDRALALMESNSVKADAAALHEAMKGGLTGLGTDEDAIMKALRGKTEEERQKLIGYYKTEYGRDLTADLKDELGGHDIDRADALLDGNTEKADAIALDQAMNGGLFGWGTDEKGIENVYSDIRGDAEGDAKKKTAALQQEALVNGWDKDRLNAELEKRGLNSAGIEQDILNRNAQTEVEFNTEYGDNYDVKDGESALRIAFDADLNNSELDLANALANNDQTAADAAKLANEFNNSWFYASDNVSNDILENQYTRALKELKADEWPAIQMELDQRAKDENWDRYTIAEEKRKAEAGLEVKAQGSSTQLMNQLVSTYDSNYSGNQYSLLDGHRNSGGLRDDLKRYTQGYGEDKAMDLMDQGGYLSPVQQLEYSTNGIGTTEADLKKVFDGKTQEEIEAITTAWSAKHPGESLTDLVTGEMSGRDEFDTLMMMRGLPQDIQEDMTNIRDRFEYEESNQIGAKIFSYALGGPLLGGTIHENMLGGHEADVLRGEMEWLERNYEIINDPDASAADKELADLLFGNGTKNFTAAVDGYREQADAVANGVASTVAITTAIVVGAILTVLSGGTAAPGAIAAVGGVAGFFGTTTGIIVAAGASSVIVSMATKRALLGSAYGDEAMMMDFGLGVVDVGVSVLTAGMGGRILQGIKMGAFSKASSSVQRRLLAFAITEYSEGAIGSIPSALLGEILNDNNFRDGDGLLRVIKNTLSTANTSGLMGVGVAGFKKLAIDPITNTNVDAETNKTTSEDISDGGELDIDIDIDSSPTLDTDGLAPIQDGSNPKVDSPDSNLADPSPKIENIVGDADVTPYDKLSDSGKTARNNGYPDAPDGYYWNSRGDTLFLARKVAADSIEIRWDAKTKTFVNKVTGQIYHSPVDVKAKNQTIRLKKQLNNWKTLGVTSEQIGDVIHYYNPKGERFAKLIDGELILSYDGFGGDIHMNPDKATTGLGKFRENWNDDGSQGTWMFLEKNGGLADGILSRVTSGEPPVNSLAFLDLPADDYTRLLNSHVKEVLKDAISVKGLKGNIDNIDLIDLQSGADLSAYIQSEVLPGIDSARLKDLLKIASDRGNESFWKKYNQPFLEAAFVRGDDIRLFSDPKAFKDSGFYGRELDEITRVGGLAEKYGYIYDPLKHSYIKP